MFFHNFKIPNHNIENISESSYCRATQYTEHMGNVVKMYIYIYTYAYDFVILPAQALEPHRHPLVSKGVSAIEGCVCP